jgi:hypothetical protein
MRVGANEPGQREENSQRGGSPQVQVPVHTRDTSEPVVGWQTLAGPHLLPFSQKVISRKNSTALLS